MLLAEVEKKTQLPLLFAVNRTDEHRLEKENVLGVFVCLFVCLCWGCTGFNTDLLSTL